MTGVGIIASEPMPESLVAAAADTFGMANVLQLLLSCCIEMLWTIEANTSTISGAWHIPAKCPFVSSVMLLYFVLVSYGCETGSLGCTVTKKEEYTTTTTTTSN